MTMYYVFFLIHASYLMSIFRPYRNIIKAGNFHKLLSSAPKAVVFDFIIVLAVFANLAVWAMEYFGMHPSLVLAVAIWFISAALAMHRLEEEIASIQARITEGEEA